MDDLINRQDALDEIHRVYEYEFPTASGVFDEFVTVIIPNLLRNLPSVEPERKNGQWIIRYYDEKSYETKEVNYNPLSFSNPCGIAYCSECGAHPLLNGHEEDVYSKYCPHCGAYMREKYEDIPMEYFENGEI